MKFPRLMEIQPLTLPLRATAVLPGSKSVTNRALLLAAMARGRSVLHGTLWADDTKVMVDSLKRLGFRVRVSQDNSGASNRTIEVEGHGGEISVKEANLVVGNAGTAARFLTTFAATGTGNFRIDGTARMRERPMAPLFEALRSLGADIVCEGRAGHFPAVIHARGLRGNTVAIRGDESSQFTSALMMIAPLIGHGGQFAVNLKGSLVSEPYLRMTAALMRKFGVKPAPIRGRTKGWKIASGKKYRAVRFAVPPDASAASYFEAAAALCGGTVAIQGLSSDFSDSLQGDAAFAGYLESLGCRVTETNGLRVTGPICKDAYFTRALNMADVSDVAITLAVLAPFLSRTTTICGLAHARLQETDRVAAVAQELAKVGVLVDCRSDGWTIYPTREFRSATIETYGDHRIAMAFSILGLKDVFGNGKPWIRIKSPDCVSKTFPDFYDKLEALRR